MMLVSGILMYVFRGIVETSVRNTMEGSLRFYGNSRPVTDAWDETQTRLHCCGIFGPNDWQNRIPISCCKQTASGVRVKCQQLGESNNEFTRFSRGCLEVTKEYVKSHAVVIGTAGIVVSCIMVMVYFLNIPLI